MVVGYHHLRKHPYGTFTNYSCTCCILCLLLSRPPCRRFASTVFRERVGIDTSEVCAAKLEMSSIGKALTSIVMGGKQKFGLTFQYALFLDQFSNDFLRDCVATSNH